MSYTPPPPNLGEIKCIDCLSQKSYVNMSIAGGSTVTVDINEPGVWIFSYERQICVQILFEESDDGSTYTQVHATGYSTDSYSTYYAVAGVIVVKFTKPYNRIVIKNNNATNTEWVAIYGCRTA